MSNADDLSVSVLLMLAEAAEDNVGQVCPRDMAARFRPPVPFRKVEIAAEHLVEIGHAKAIEYEHATTDYHITQKGLNWVEKHFERRESPNGNTWTRRDNADEDESKTDASTPGVHIHNTFSPQNFFQPTDQRIDRDRTAEGASSLWSAWGTWVGVLLTALAIVVSLYVAGKI